MKHKIILILLSLLLCAVSVNAMAYDAYIDGIYYCFFGTEATVVGKSVSDENINAYSGDVIIPESVWYNDFIYSRYSTIKLHIKIITYFYFRRKPIFPITINRR